MPSQPARTATTKPHAVTRSEFARRAGRAPASITEACQGPLKAACLPGGRIDAVHPAAVAWAVKRGIDPASLLDPVVRRGVRAADLLPSDAAKTGNAVCNADTAKTTRRGRGRPVAGAEPATASDAEYSEPTDVTDLLRLTLHELTTRHGSAQGFSDWLDTRRQIAETARLESRNDRDAGRLISAELVKVHVFGMIDGQNRRLLTNAPRTIAVRALSVARTGGTLEDLIALATTAISTELRVTVAKARRAIVACKTGDNPPDVSPPEHAAIASEVPGFARDVTARLRDAAPILLDFLLKEVIRAASGDRWNPEIAAEVIATKTELAPEAARVMGNILAAHIQNAVTDAITQERSR